MSSSARRFFVVKVLRPVGRALIAYGLYWVWVPGVSSQEILEIDLFSRFDSR